MANEFWRRGKSKVYFATATILNSGPTQAQIAAATNLTPQIAAMEGFETAVERIDITNLGSTFTPSLTGPQTISEPSITFHDSIDATPPTSATNDPIRVALASGASGTLILCPYGTTTGDRVELWRVESSGANDIWSLGNESAKYRVDFGVTDTPVRNAVIAA